MSPFTAKQYDCSGSMDPRIVGHSFDELSAIWQKIDRKEHERLVRIRDGLTAPFGTVADLAQRIRSKWPIKSSQNGPSDYSLPEGIISVEKIASFLRLVEQVAIEADRSCLVVYWSRHNATKLLPPEGKPDPALVKSSACLSTFSERKVNPPDEWCFWMESSGLCLIIYGVHDGGGKSSVGRGSRALDAKGRAQFSGVPRRSSPYGAESSSSSVAARPLKKKKLVGT